MEIISRDEAWKLGKIHYFTGKPCQRNHVAPRFVSNGGCAECINWKRLPGTNAPNVGMPPSGYAFRPGMPLTPSLLSYVHMRVLDQVDRYADEYLQLGADIPVDPTAPPLQHAVAVKAVWEAQQEAHESGLRAAGWTDAMLAEARKYV